MGRVGRVLSILRCAARFGFVAAAIWSGSALAQPAAETGEPVVRPVIPNFWDPRAKPERPDILPARTVRFLTSDDYPPLHFAGPDGNPTGFSVELARAVCERLRMPCTVQARRFDGLLEALSEGKGDVVAAAIPLNAGLRARFLATTTYFRLPARFVARRGGPPLAVSATALKGKSVAVVEGTAHEAFMGTFFSAADRKPFQNLLLAQGALRRGEVDYLFADGLSLALWIGGKASENCCVFAGGPYLESRFFGEGLGFVLRLDDQALERAIDYALQKLWEEGTYAEIYLRFFPVSPF